VMKLRKITCLFVVNRDIGQTALGILNIHDLLRAGIV